MSTPIFPQAYTVETVAKAFEWLQAQPQLQSSVKSTDQLINLYLKAKRMGGAAKEYVAPETFKADLKNLAQSLRTFDDEHLPPVPQSTYTPQAPIPQVAPPAQVPAQIFDAKTQAILHDVQQSLNLSSSSEAIRLLVTLGYERIKVIFPNG